MLWLSANWNGKLRLEGSSLSPLVGDNKHGIIKRALKVRPRPQSGMGSLDGEIRRIWREMDGHKKRSILLPIRSESPLERHVLLQSGKVQKRWRKNDAFLCVGPRQTIRTGNVFPQLARNDEMRCFCLRRSTQVSPPFSQFCDMILRLRRLCDHCPLFLECGLTNGTKLFVRGGVRAKNFARILSA